MLPSSLDLLILEAQGGAPRSCRGAAAERAPSLKPCKLQYKVDVTLFPCRRDGPFFQICCKIQYEINTLVSDRLLIPLGHHGARLPPNCNIWLRLDCRPLFSAWFFGTQLWYFQPRGRFLGPRSQIWTPAGPCWAGDFFVQTWDLEKDGFVEEMVTHGVARDSVRGEWIVWCPGGLWARPFPPKPSQ